MERILGESEVARMRLYALDRGAWEASSADLPVEKKNISLFSLFIDGEKRSVKTMIGRAFFYLTARGRFWVYYVTDRGSGQVIHTSYVTEKSFKFPFMSPGEIHIGPCYTAPSHRGRGIYRKVLRGICADRRETNSRAYMMVHEDNLPSIRGIEAAGFRHIGSVERTALLKVYRRTDHG